MIIILIKKLLMNQYIYCISLLLLTQTTVLSQSVNVIEYDRYFGSGKLYSIDIPNSFIEVEEETADLSFVKINTAAIKVLIMDAKDLQSIHELSKNNFEEDYREFSPQSIISNFKKFKSNGVDVSTFNLSRYENDELIFLLQFAVHKGKIYCIEITTNIKNLESNQGVFFVVKNSMKFY